MLDLSIKPHGSVRTKRPRTPLADSNTVRAYQHSPGYVALQLRSDRSYSNVILTIDEVRRLAVLLFAVSNPTT